MHCVDFNFAIYVVLQISTETIYNFVYKYLYISNIYDQKTRATKLITDTNESNSFEKNPPEVENGHWTNASAQKAKCIQMNKRFF